MRVKELARFTRKDLIEMKSYTLMPYLLNRNVINNPNAYRLDDPMTGDIIFYEEPTNDRTGESNEAK